MTSALGAGFTVAHVSAELVERLILLGSYLAWAGGAFAIVYSDLGRRDGDGRDQWGLAQWGGLSVVAGGLLLPFYFSRTRGVGDGLGRGIALGLGVALLAMGVRLGLSALFRVPVL